jgi:hypothetical protein
MIGFYQNFPEKQKGTVIFVPSKVFGSEDPVAAILEKGAFPGVGPITNINNNG